MSVPAAIMQKRHYMGLISPSAKDMSAYGHRLHEFDNAKRATLTRIAPVVELRSRTPENSGETANSFAFDLGELVRQTDEKKVQPTIYVKHVYCTATSRIGLRHSGPTNSSYLGLHRPIPSTSPVQNPDTGSQGIRRASGILPMTDVAAILTIVKVARCQNHKDAPRINASILATSPQTFQSLPHSVLPSYQQRF
ncbi:hypothetical protein F5887DRAFT_1256460 [Amanita rubescens]|nr:hypothetical protein F5887DRAFT_1256460 [Amanita rubescens]